MIRLAVNEMSAGDEKINTSGVVAASAVALLHYKNKWKDNNVVAVISGGNLDIETLKIIIK